MVNKDVNARLRVYNNTLSQSQLFTTSWNAFYNIFDTYTNPRADSTKWIFATKPFDKDETKTDFPRLIITDVDVNGVSPENFDKLRYNIIISLTIEHTSSEKLDVLTDSIHNHVLTNKTTLYNAGIRNPKLIKTNKSYYDDGSFIIHERRLDYMFDYWISGIHGI